ncbi:MAG: hypothetical protein EXS16_06980 [Gemmataceae bacterium]|nr:hypothetical protein [Gemmataceae bacterium]
MHYRILILIALCLAFFPVVARSNMPPVNVPPPVRGNDKKPATRVLRVDANVTIILTYSVPGEAPHDRARLFIPKRIADAQALNGAVRPERAMSAHPTWISGLALSAAFVTGGFWLVGRPKSSGAKLLVSLLVTTTVLITIGQSDLLGDIPSPWWMKRQPRPIPQWNMPGPHPLAPPAPLAPPNVPIIVEGNRIQIGVDVVILADGDHMELVLPKSLMPAGGLKQVGKPGI